MLYDEARMALTKERLEDLGKEKKLSFEQLSKQLAERGVNISYTNLKNYEINDPVHPLYGRLSQDSISVQIRKESTQKMEEAQKMLDACGYCSVEYDLISQVHMENAIGILNTYLRELPKHLYQTHMQKAKDAQ